MAIASTTCASGTTGLTTLTPVGQQWLPVPDTADEYQKIVPTSGCVAATTAIASADDCLAYCNTAVTTTATNALQYCSYDADSAATPPAPTCNVCQGATDLTWGAASTTTTTYTPCNACPVT